MYNMNVSPGYILAGEATWTVSNQSGQHYTYHSYQAKPTKEFPDPAWFLKVMVNGNNIDTDSFAYIGKLVPMLKDTCRLKLTGRSRFKDDTEVVRVARWALRAIWQVAYHSYQLPLGMSIKHHGHCGRCGQKLTHPASLDTGLGPECAGAIGVAWAEHNHRMLVEVAK